LDRLHYEKDPCVKYDLQKKLWIYLHKNRTVDYPAWNEHVSKIEIKTEPDAGEAKVALDDNGNNLSISIFIYLYCHF